MKCDDAEFRHYPRVALIGPVLPYRGGIAQYTTELHRALTECCRLQTISFRRQYPAWLYPGESDRELGIQDHREPGVDYSLDALNPLSWVTAARQIAAHECKLAIIQWWTLYWAPALATIARMLRQRGVPVIFLCHNLVDHDGGRLKRFAATKLLAQADAYLVHSKEQAESLRGSSPGKPVCVHPHPTYDRFPAATDPLPQRGRLELLFFGFIRPYKGLEVLVNALALLNDHEVHLSVAGEPWCAPDQLRAKIRTMGAPNINLTLGYADDPAVANLFVRADLVVLPYRSATGSGVAAIAYHYDRPVLATRVGGLPDIVEEGRTGFLIPPDSPVALAERLRTLDRNTLLRMRENVRNYKMQFTWKSLANRLLEFANEISCDQQGSIVTPAKLVSQLEQTL